MVRGIILIAAIGLLTGCPTKTVYVKVPIPIKVPCIAELPEMGRSPLALLSVSDTAKALEPGNEWMYLDAVMEQLHRSDAYIKALHKAIEPCIKK